MSKETEKIKSKNFSPKHIRMLVVICQEGVTKNFRMRKKSRKFLLILFYTDEKQLIQFNFHTYF